MHTDKEKDIYKLMNEAKIDINSYEEEKLSEIEKKKMKKSVMQNLNKKENTKNRKSKKHYYQKRGLLVASVLIVAVGVLGNEKVQGAIHLLNYGIAQGLGIEKDLASYTEVLNQAITQNGATIQLNEVILNNDELIITSTIKVDESFEHGFVHTGTKIFINGKESFLSGGGGSSQIDDYTVIDAMTYQLDEKVQNELEGNVDIKIVMKDIQTDTKVYKGRWIFEFTVNGDELRADTKTMPLDYAFNLDDEQTVQLIKYTQNDIGNKIYYDRGDKFITYDIELRGEDDLGNEIRFYLSHESKGKGVLELSTVLGSPLSEEATSLTLTPYAVKFPETSGKMSNDFQPVGEAFEIDLSRLTNK